MDDQAARIPPSEWAFPSPEGADEHGLVCLGGDLASGTLLAAYQHGLFPMPVSTSRLRRSRDALGWFSPDPRAVVPLDGLRVSRSLRRSLRRFTITTDVAFDTVMRSCGDPRRPHGWITAEFVDAYVELHRIGFAHSIEVWDGVPPPDGHVGELVGGLYGVAVGGLFAGESMFHTATDASKVALVALVDRLVTLGYGLLDVQWQTDHLASLGAVEVERTDYLVRLGAALERSPAAWAGGELSN